MPLMLVGGVAGLWLGLAHAHAAAGHACNREPCEGGFLDSGDYAVTEVVGPDGPVDASHPWRVGAQVHVDRAAGTMTIRYERDGSTYEVRYTLGESRD